MTSRRATTPPSLLPTALLPGGAACDWPPCILIDTLGAALLGRGPGDDEDDPLMRRARLFTWRLERAYADAAGEHIEELFSDLGDVGNDFENLGWALVEWLNVTETLVQEAEKIYGPGPGKGRLKAAQVKAVLIHVVLSDDKLKIPHVPRVFRAVVVEAGVTLAIDFVVALLNENDGLWQAEPQEREPVKAALSLPVLWIAAVGRWLERHSFGLWLTQALDRAVLKANPLTPALAEAVGRMRLDDKMSIRKVQENVAHVMAWVQEHRPQLAALIQLASVAVQEAEDFLTLSNDEKKAYARCLILVFLEDSGLIGDSALVRALVEWAVDWGIEFVVAVFRKRAIFPIRT
jgi:hypothetical protein